ncbi:MAG: PEP-CTERM sorting domain-containing protein [Burkholderiales bacterium]|nr:PEP-CTERM sorting domain-containing protein [Burkholderiales bacterium]
MKRKLTRIALAALGSAGLLWSAAASSALITSFTASGTVGATVAAYPTAFSAGAGTLTVSGIPAGASILQAYLYANNYFGTPDASATFDGNALGAVAPFATDGGFSAYRWDVTGLVTGDGAYSASYSGPTNTYGLALAVAFSHPSLPVSTVCINDGAVDIDGPETASTSCAGMAAGSGTLWIHTAADNALGESGEEIRYNGAVVGGPIDANLGDFASLFELAVTNLDGLNTAEIFSPADQFGWDLAVFAGPAGETGVPEPGSLALLGLGLAAFALARRRKS